MTERVELTCLPLNYNGIDLLKQCLPSVLQAAEASSVKAEVAVVDNASTDDSLNWLKREHPGMKVFALKENRILASYNEVLRELQSPYVMLLNNDMILNPDTIAPLMARIASDPKIFAVSPKVEADDLQEQYLCRRAGVFRRGHIAIKPMPKGSGGALYFHGGAAVIRREVFLQLGGFDPRLFYFEDNDLSWRAWRAGWRCCFEPESSVFHLAGRTTAVVHGREGKKRALKEKASNLFILKNIHDPAMMGNFVFWFILKALKGLVTFDGHRLWSTGETLVHLPYALSRRNRKGLSDLDIFKAIEQSDPILPNQS